MISFNFDLPTIQFTSHKFLFKLIFVFLLLLHSSILRSKFQILRHEICGLWFTIFPKQKNKQTQQKKQIYIPEKSINFDLTQQRNKKKKCFSLSFSLPLSLPLLRFFVLICFTRKFPFNVFVICSIFVPTSLSSIKHTRNISFFLFQQLF